MKMKRTLIFSIIVLLGAFCISPVACSKTEDLKPEKGPIEKMTKRTADAIVDRFQAPIKKAKKTKDMEEERMRNVDEALEDQ